jgi:hypothetical protein
LLKPTVFKHRVREGKRPQLPHYCPSQWLNKHALEIGIGGFCNLYEIRFRILIGHSIC